MARPKGSKNAQVDVAHVEVTRCRKCGSTERTAYYNTRVREASGTDAEGRAYNQIVWRRTTCINCGQVRDDISREYNPRQAA